VQGVLQNGAEKEILLTLRTWSG